MCLTLPYQVQSIAPPFALVARGETKRRVRTEPVGRVRIGQWVFVHADLAIRRISARDAKLINDAVGIS